MYTEYKIARDGAWQTLINIGANELPIKLSAIAKHYGIQLLKYSDINQEPFNEDGYSINFDNRLIIFYNELKPKNRVRFTIAHELGHCLLGHLSAGEKTFRHNSETNEYKDAKEIQANIFARDILMPATVLHSLKVNSPKQISQICNVSIQSAEIRYNRLLELNKRGMFNKHPLERQVYNQFKDYIENYMKLNV